MTVAEILEQAQTLSVQERKELVKLLNDTLDTSAPPTDLHSILEFEGIAAHLAEEQDPQDYVNQIRGEWDQ